MQATLMALDSATGSTVWTTSLDHSGHGAIRWALHLFFQELASPQGSHPWRWFSGDNGLPGEQRGRFPLHCGRRQRQGDGLEVRPQRQPLDHHGPWGWRHAAGSQGCVFELMNYLRFQTLLSDKSWSCQWRLCYCWIGLDGRPTSKNQY